MKPGLGWNGSWSPFTGSLPTAPYMKFFPCEHVGLNHISPSLSPVPTASASLGILDMGISYQNRGYGLAQPQTSHALKAVLRVAGLRALLSCCFSNLVVSLVREFLNQVTVPRPHI